MKRANNPMARPASDSTLNALGGLVVLVEMNVAFPRKESPATSSISHMKMAAKSMSNMVDGENYNSINFHSIFTSVTYNNNEVSFV